MKPFRKFYFDSFEFDKKKLKAKFFYNFDKEESFEEVIDFKSVWFKIRKDLDPNVINNMLFHMHMALWISYYKLYPTKELIVESGYLDENAINFWVRFYKNWLGEFLFLNQISPKKLFNFMNISRDSYSKGDFSLKNRSLIPLWWWKDSIVSIEIFKKAELKFKTVVFWKSDKIKDSVSQIVWTKSLLIKRKLSDKLFKLNEEWYFNGHIPITWVIAFALTLSAYLYDYKYIVLSNEKSADLPNTTWKNLDINHQYSKSLEFENDINSYIKNYISDDMRYFSLLRWMYEYKIAKIFSKIWKEYFNVFSSCNNNFKINSEDKKQKHIWCNKCPKCTFVFVLLSAFLGKKDLHSIFWEDLYENENLETVFKELFWVIWIKPFECVWAKEELFLAWKKALKNYWKKLPYNLKILKEEILDKISEEEYKNLKKEFSRTSKEDFIPDNIKDKVKDYIS